MMRASRAKLSCDERKGVTVDRLLQLQVPEQCGRTAQWLQVLNDQASHHKVEASSLPQFGANKYECAIHPVLEPTQAGSFNVIEASRNSTLILIRSGEPT